MRIAVATDCKDSRARRARAVHMLISANAVCTDARKTNKQTEYRNFMGCTVCRCNLKRLYHAIVSCTSCLKRDIQDPNNALQREEHFEQTKIRITFSNIWDGLK